MSDDELDSGPRAAERLTFFSDAVVAIAMTLLAIELPVPEGSTIKVFWASVEHDEGHYAAFLISFVVIAAAWRGHHELFQYAKRTDGRLVTLNTCWLLTIVLIPFATKLLIAGGQSLTTHALRFGFYALLQVLAVGRAVRDAAAHDRQRAGRPAAIGDGPPDQGGLRRNDRLRPVHPGLLRHARRLGAVVRQPGGDRAAPQAPAPRPPRRQDS